MGRGEKTLRDAARDGHAAAHTELGNLLYYRDGPSDRDEAIAHWRSGALLGDAMGALNLGRYLILPPNFSEPIDLEEAHFWLRKASSAKDIVGIEAKEVLGISLINQAIGDDAVEPDIVAADPRMIEGVELLLVPAEAGREDSIKMLCAIAQLPTKIDASNIYQRVNSVLDDVYFEESE